MKTVLTVGIGGKSFTIETEAYSDLKNYLNAFKNNSKLGVQGDETMKDLETRIAELFSTKIDSFRNVVDSKMVDEITAQLGMPDGQPYVKNARGESGQSADANMSGGSYNYKMVPPHKLYRDPGRHTLGGVCTGLAYYFNLDPVLMKVIFIIAFLAGLFGFLVYIILWIVIPRAINPVQMCELYGIPPTAENLARFAPMFK
ncbi:MAG: PspC domain-containing protein [Bacteroidales bacterium]|nr:PspC domain-containing protein [Bacteroidales bacterium]MDD3911236.1 PspC domain-containing protein [Bacteroidales bacterium]MDD4420870.1 PspC domain-containing protein [Bacteroidales bacterium]